MGKGTKNRALITVKDYKKDFPNNPKFRLLNYRKNNAGRISKNNLESAIRHTYHYEPINGAQQKKP